jgi:hypothetical protein
VVDAVTGGVITGAGLSLPLPHAPRTRQAVPNKTILFIITSSLYEILLQRH